MSVFGDFTDDDAADTARADPVAVARILWADLRARDPARFRAWEAHTAAELDVIVDAVRALLTRLRLERSL